MMDRIPATGDGGYSLVEMLVTLALLGLLVGMASLYLTPAAAPLHTSGELVEGFVRLSRSRAISTTSAYRVSAASTTRLIADTADSCSDADWTPDDGIDLNLPSKVQLTDTTWTVCFTPRGVSASNLTIPFSHPDFGSSGVEILLGGGTRIVP